jgi:thioredoxin 1
MGRKIVCVLLAAGMLVLSGCPSKSQAVKLTDSNFDERVLRSKGLALVDFGAVWCAPCRELEPVIRELADEFAGKVIVAQVDVDENRELARRYEVESVPTILVFKDGKLKERLVGLQPKYFLKNMLIALQ